MKLKIQLRPIRKREQLSQKELARKTDLTQAYISLIEQGKKVPTLTTLEKLSSALNCSVDELLSDLPYKQNLT